MQAVMSQQYGMLARFLPTINAQTLDALAPKTVVSATEYRVLILETSVPLARLLATGLAAESLSVDITHDLESAMKHVERTAYDLFILDLDITDMDGAVLLESLRAKLPNSRILALSAQTGIEGLVFALDHGADDYLPKPFSLLEMMARTRALRRRSASPNAAPKSGIVLHRDQCRVQRDGKFIDLTPREFTLLEYLMQNAGKTVSRAVLTQEVWNLPVEGNTNIVDVYIKYLRDKLDGDHEVKMIRTVRGMGYLFQA